ncbi:unnamed protein product [Ectocarpus sp. CCAP 1310/34]|nr:unnamed protein product [Ectocarpus sp. CCAP 1310/34]
MDCAVCMTRLATTRCAVFATDVSTRVTAIKHRLDCWGCILEAPLPGRAGNGEGEASGCTGQLETRWQHRT